MSDLPERWANIAEDAAYFENEPLRAARIGAQAVLAALRRQVMDERGRAANRNGRGRAANRNGGPAYVISECYGEMKALSFVLDLLDTGGSDE